jgi:hypothetical protein
VTLGPEVIVVVTIEEHRLLRTARRLSIVVDLRSTVLRCVSLSPRQVSGRAGGHIRCKLMKWRWKDIGVQSRARHARSCELVSHRRTNEIGTFFALIEDCRIAL